LSRNGSGKSTRFLRYVKPCTRAADALNIHGMSLLLNEMTGYSLLIRHVVYKKSSNFKDKNCPGFAALFNQSVPYITWYKLQAHIRATTQRYVKQAYLANN
jgi:hypothetical protein